MSKNRWAIGNDLGGSKIEYFHRETGALIQEMNQDVILDNESQIFTDYEKK